MLDLEIAKRQLREKGFSLVIVKKGMIVFETRRSGLGGFFKAIDKFGRKGLAGSSVADKVVGRAAAMLCAYCGVKAVYALVVSDCGKEALKENDVELEFESLVPSILNQGKTDACPFEKAVATISDVDDAYEKLRSCKKEMG